jgi:hypothetical protein
MQNNNSLPNSNYSLEAEQSVIGGLILKNDALPDVSNVLSLDDFYDKRHQLLFKAIQSLESQGQPLDLVTLNQQLQKDDTFNAIGGGEYLGHLVGNTPSAANIMAYARIVKKYSIERQAIALMTQAIAMNNGEHDPLDNLAQLITLQGELARATNGFQNFGKRTNTVINEDDGPIEWLVDDLITTSSRTLLVAKPKVGKTIISLDIALSVAYGGYAIGKYKCKQGDVLYLALEGGEKRLKNTIKRLMAAYHMDTLPNSFYHETECLSIDNGGLTAIEAWCQRVNNPSLIVIDILQNFRPTVAKGQSVYDADYASTQALKTIVEKYNVAILIDHHANKRTADGDVIDLISGSNGLAGGVDNTLVMIRPLRKKTGTLHRIGRDYVCDDDITIRLEDEGYFSVINPEDALLKERKEIVDMMKQGYNTAKEIADAMGGRSAQSVSRLFYKMVNDGIVKKAGYGKFELVDDGAKLGTSDTTSSNQAWNKGLTSSCTGTTKSTTAKSGTSDTTNCKPNNDVYDVSIVDDEVVPLVPVVVPVNTPPVQLEKLSKPNDDGALSKADDEVVSLVPCFTPPTKNDKGHGKTGTKGKPLNGELVALREMLEPIEYQAVATLLEIEASTGSEVNYDLHRQLITKFITQYTEYGAAVIRTLIEKYGLEYPFTDTMSTILKKPLVKKGARRNWRKIKPNLGDDAEVALEKLIAAGFVTYDNETETIQLS